jgi:hypothetical protein
MTNQPTAAKPSIPGLMQAADAKLLLSVRPTLKAELHDALTSRKLWALIIGLVTDFFGWYSHGTSTEVAVLGALGIISAYCVGQGLADRG